MEVSVQPAAQTEDIIQELQELSLDPTLDQCCRRDIQSQVHRERIRHALQQQDRVDARERITAAVFCRDATRLAAMQEAPDPQASQHAHIDSELEELRRQRLRQLQAQSAVQQEQRKVGFGTLNTVHEGKLLGLLSDTPGRGLLVVHLAVQGHEPCNALDECLESAAAQYRGTYFARVAVSRNTPLVSQLQLPHDVPALLVCRQGTLLGKTHIQQFGQHDIWEEEVLSYLGRFKVLVTCSSSVSPSAAGETHSRADDGDSDRSDAAADEVEGDWETPCEVCGRTYAHTHVRALYSTQHRSDADSDEGSGD